MHVAGGDRPRPHNERAVHDMRPDLDEGLDDAHPTRIRQGVRCNNLTAEMCTTTRDERILEGINAKNAIKNAIREWSRAKTRLLSTLRKRGVALDGSCGPRL